MKKILLVVFILSSIVPNLFSQEYDYNLFTGDFSSDVFNETLREYNYHTSFFSGLFSNNIVKILLGQKDLLDKDLFWDDDLNIFSLSQLNNNHLRLLRNMIYAKYGLRFSSPELTNYFSKFDWYRPRASNVNSSLTKADRYNLNLIQAFENRNENSPNTNWDNKKKIGVWQDMPQMAAGWSNRFVIHSNNVLEYYLSQMGQLKICHCLIGTYKIKGNVLEYTVNKILYTMHGIDIEYDGSFGSQWEDYVLNTITLSKPMIFKFPISGITTETIKSEWNGTYTKETIGIGGVKYYKMSDNVNEKF